MQTATVGVKTIVYDATRTGTESFPDSGTIRGTMLPIGGEMLYRQYGETYRGEFEFYSRTRNAGLVMGNQLTVAGVAYLISGVRDYGKVVVCLLRKAM